MTITIKYYDDNLHSLYKSVNLLDDKAFERLGNSSDIFMKHNCINIDWKNIAVDEVIEKYYPSCPFKKILIAFG